MRDYGKVSPQFWMGKTGKALRREGAAAQLVALYLITCPHANMLGLYYLPLSYIAHDTGLSLEEAERGLQGCIASGMCLYDDFSEMVWIFEMARFQVADELKGRDLRIKAVQGAYDALPANPFLPAFFERYAAALGMVSGRFEDGSATPFEGASKPLRSQEQEQEQNQQHHQDQGQPQEQEHDAMRGDFAQLSPAEEPQPLYVEKKSYLWTQGRPLKTPLPEGFGISESVRKWAAQRNITHLDLHLEHFISTVRRNGYTYVDWDEALKVAIRKDWADLGKPSLAAVSTSATTTAMAPASKLGKAGQATANNAKRWLEEFDASN